MTGNNKCLLDTSIVVRALKKNAVVASQLDLLDEIYVPVNVIGELLYGAYKSDHLLKHLNETEQFLKKCIILTPDIATAGIYGKTKAALVNKGRPIPENDIWIAAIALQHNLSVYENDKHFREIDGLQLFNPLSSI